MKNETANKYLKIFSNTKIKKNAGSEEMAPRLRTFAALSRDEFSSQHAHQSTHNHS